MSDETSLIPEQPVTVVGSDHDQVIRLAVSLEALDRIIRTFRASDEAARILAAESLYQKLEKLNEFRGALSDAQATMVPRAEVRLLVDALDLRITNLAETSAARLETLATSVSTLGQTLVALRSTLAGEQDGAQDQIAALGRSRNLMFAVIGVILVVIALVVSIYVGVHNHSTGPSITTPTTLKAAALETPTPTFDYH